MKSVMACSPLNSFSQGSTMGLNGFLLLPSRQHCKIHPDLNMPDDVRSQWSSSGSTSKASLKSYSQILAAALPLTTPLSCFPPSCYVSCLSVGFCQNLCVHSPLALLHQSAGEETLMLGAQPPVLHADRNFVVVQALILIDLFKAFQTVSFCLLRFAPCLFRGCRRQCIQHAE